MIIYGHKEGRLHIMKSDLSGFWQNPEDPCEHLIEAKQHSDFPDIQVNHIDRP